jgi:uncharacterized protein
MAARFQHRVHVGALRQRLGQRLTVEVEQRLPQLEVIATRTTSEPVTGTLTIESVERGVSVTGYLKVDWIADCRRCLEPVTGSEQTFVDEIFQVGAEPGGDLIPFDGETVVLDQVIHDTAMASLPLSPLCGDDCQGPDPDRYLPGVGERPIDPDAPNEPAGDPRWAALGDLKLE